MKDILRPLFGSLIAMGFMPSYMAVAGGCLRDNMLDPSKVAKDIDIVLAQCDFNRFDECLLPAGWELVHVYDSEYGGEIKSEDFDKRISEVVKLRYEYPAPLPSFDAGTVDVDLIFATSKYNTYYEFVRDFDFNVNQWAISAYDILLPCPAKPAFLGTELGKLVETRGTEVHPDRRARMIRLAHQYGWDISDFQGELL